MDGMLGGGVPMAFNQNLNTWDTESLVIMTSAFQRASSYNQPMDNWKTSKVTSLLYTFFFAEQFNQDLSKWDVGKVTTFEACFGYALAFNNGANTDINPITGRTGLNGWNIGSGATGSIAFTIMFRSNDALKPLAFNRSLANWDTSKVTNMGNMFQLCTSLKQDFSLWDVSAVTNFSSMFLSCNINDDGTTTNYDALLLSWAQQNVQNSKGISFGSSKYSAAGFGDAAAGTGKAHLVASLTASPTPGHAWNITDGGLQT
jgi:surface protein